MRMRTWRLVSATVVVAAVCGSADLIVGRALLQPTISSRATAWAKTLDVGQKKTALSQMAQYPAAYRKALVQSLPAREVVAVFKQHFQAYRDSHPNMSTDQQAVLDANLQYLIDKSRRGSRPPTAEEKQRLDKLRIEAERVFSKKDAVNLFSRFGPSNAVTGAKEPGVVNRLTRWIQASMSISAVDEWCACRTDSFYSCISCHSSSKCNIYEVGYYCFNGTCPSGTCNPSCDTSAYWWGCGYLWESTCDGRCGWYDED